MICMYACILHSLSFSLSHTHIYIYIYAYDAVGDSGRQCKYKMYASFWRSFFIEQGISEGFDSCDRPSNLTQIRFKSKSYRAPLLHYIELCASSQIPRGIQTGLTVRKRSIQVKIGYFWSRVTNGSYSPETLNSGQNRWFVVPCDFEIWWMTLENNSATLQCCVKHCALFHSNRWIQTKVTVWKRSTLVTIGNLLSRVTLKFDSWLWKTIGHLFFFASSLLHDFIAISEFKPKLQSGNTQFGSKSAIFCPVWPWNLTDDLEKQ